MDLLWANTFCLTVNNTYEAIHNSNDKITFRYISKRIVTSLIMKVCKSMIPIFLYLLLVKDYLFISEMLM